MLSSLGTRELRVLAPVPDYWCTCFGMWSVDPLPRLLKRMKEPARRVFRWMLGVFGARSRARQLALLRSARDPSPLGQRTDLLLQLSAFERPQCLPLWPEWARSRRYVAESGMAALEGVIVESCRSLSFERRTHSAPFAYSDPAGMRRLC